MNNAPVKITVELPVLPKPTTDSRKLAELERQIREAEVACDVGRELVASLAAKLGFWVHVGGRHVAIHTVSGTPRIAIITGHTPDWL
jgi:hypothetical protein